MATFDDLYETIFSYSFEANDKPQRVYCRPDVERLCWNCGRTREQTKFATDAHVIATLLGNRSLCSLEECDECNHRFGRTIEQSLSDYLTLWRAISRIRTRKGSFKHRTVPNRSYIEGQPDANRLIMEIFEGEDTVQIEDRGQGNMLLRMSVPPSNPIAANNARAAVTSVSRPAPPFSPIEMKELDCPVKLLAIDRAGSILAASTINIRSTKLEATGFELTVAAERIGISLRFRTHARGAGEVQGDWCDPCFLPIASAFEHLRLRKSLTAARTLELRVHCSSAPLAWAQLGSAVSQWVPSPITLEIAERLAMIAAKTGEDIYLPRGMNEQAIR